MSAYDPGDEPTPEEIQAYLAELREADVGDIVLQAFTVLGSGAEVKLGRRDARVLIDSMAALLQAAGQTLGDSRDKLEQAIGQLKMAQVQAERQLAGEAAAREAGPDGGDGGPPPPAQQPPSQQPQQKATDRLWIPGRD